MIPPRTAVALSWVLRAGLAGVLGVAGALKLADPAAFATQIANYHLLPQLSPVVATTLPTIELVLALALLLAPRPWRLAAAVAAVPVLVTFLVAVASAYFRGIDISCGCFGTGTDKIGPLTLVRNVGLLALAGAIVWLEAAMPQTPPAVPQTPATK